MCYQLLAARSLRDESMKVYRALHRQDIEGARKAVSMIVGRDTERLDAAGIAKAAVETVAENASDGVIAPMIFIAIGGADVYKRQQMALAYRKCGKTEDQVQHMQTAFQHLAEYGQKGVRKH